MIITNLLLNLLVIGRLLALGKKEEDRSTAATSQRDSHGLKYPERLFIGGSESANIKEAPYAVALVEKYGRGGFQIPFCSGAIISKQWVLSAAHCLYGFVDVPLAVIAGCDSLDELRAEHNEARQVRSPIEIKIHPHFQRNADDNATVLGGYDVVLIRVASFLFGPGVNQIGLFDVEWIGVKVRHRKYRGTDFSRVECAAYGWGNEKPNVPSLFLRTANFTALHGIGGCGICVDKDQTRRLICATTLSSHSACPGDSGGPLVCKGLLAGVAHTTSLCHKRDHGRELPGPPVCGREDVFGTWMYVCPMLSWIHQIVPDAPDQPVSCTSQRIVAFPGLLPGCFLLHSSLTSS